MKTWLLVCLLTLTPVLSGCHAPVTVTTPQAQTAYRADQVVVRIGEFQQVVIDSSHAGTVKVGDAHVIVEWTTASLATLGATPDGWQAALKAGWPQVRTIASRYPVLVPYVTILDGILGAP